jgi:hypothetical protein
MRTRPELRSLANPALASTVVSLTLTILLYHDALSLPLFSDDLIQVPWLESITWRELWTSPSPYRYYRPLWYTLWRLWGMLFGGLDPFGLHLLNLIAHFAASCLAGLLAATWAHPSPQRTGSKAAEPTTIIACLAAALFAVFPFSRQAVAWPGAVYNPLVSAMAASALIAYDQGRKSDRHRWIGGALLLSALAPLTYETGLLVGILVVLAEGLGRLTHRWPRRSGWPLAFLCLLPVNLFLWRAMRGKGIIGFGLTPADLRGNAGYLVQGLIYPVAPLAQRAAERLSAASELCLWLVALPTLALLAWFGLRRNRDLVLLGGIWFTVFAIPPVVSMEADWFALAPRFLYMTAAGACLIWAAALAEWLLRLRAPFRLLATALVLVVFLIPAAGFVRDGMHLYHVACESIWQADAAASQQTSLFLVNLPTRITPHVRTYPLGFEGVTPLPKRIPPDKLLYAHPGYPVQAISFGVVAMDEPVGYAYQPYGQPGGWQDVMQAVRQGHTVYLARYEADRIHLVEAGAAGTPSTGEPVARFNDHLTLLRAVVTCDESAQVHLTAHWQVEEPVETDATVFAHLITPDGSLITQADGYPLLHMLPFWLWERGEIVRDVRHFPPAAEGDYVVRLGLWDLSTGDRWLAAGTQDGTVLLPVHCP